MPKFLLIFFLLLAAPVLGNQHRVRCSWMIGAVAYLNAISGMYESEVRAVEIGGEPENDDELSEFLTAFAPVYRLEQSTRVIPGDERIDKAMAVLGGMKQSRNQASGLTAVEVPRRFVVDPMKPKQGDEALVDARLEIVQRRLQIGLQNALRGESAGTVLAPPFIAKGEAVFPIVNRLIHNPDFGVESYRRVPRVRMKSGALKLTVALVTAMPFLYLGADRAIPLNTVGAGLALGSVPGWMGLWDGIRANYEFIRNRFASDQMDTYGLEQFAMRGTLNRGRAGQVFWLHGKEKGPWEMDLVIYIQPDDTAVFLSFVTRDL